MKKYEIRIVFVPSDDQYRRSERETILKHLLDDGWEPYSAAPHSDGTHTLGHYHYLRRSTNG